MTPDPEAKSIVDELAMLAARRKGPPCTTGLALAEMTDDIRTVVLAAFADPRVPGSHIAEVLKNRQFQVTEHSIQRHRRGDCQCPSQTS